MKNGGMQSRVWNGTANSPNRQRSLTSCGPGLSILLVLAVLFVQCAVLAVGPTISSQPASQTVTSGGQASFSVSASGTGQLRYQWRKNGFDLPGQIGDTFSIVNANINDAADYSVVVTDDTGSTTSASARLTIGTPQTPSITTQPSSQSVAAGATVMFHVVASGSSPLSYQWQKNSFDIPGQTGSTLTLTSVTSADAGSYSVIVSNSAGTATSLTASLTVSGSNAPSIAVQPVSQTVAAGSQVTFSVSANGSNLLYQCYKNNTALSGKTGSTLTLAGVTASDAGSYTVSVSNSFGAATSQGATLTVSSGSSGPTITAQPLSQSVNAGDRVTLTVSASGSAPFSFQWRKNGSDLSGATNASFIVNSATAADAGDYMVLVSDASGSQLSATATVTVAAGGVTAPSIQVQPVSQTVPLGGRASFSVGASGSPQLTYQWSKDGNSLAGQTSATLIIAAVAAGDAGDYVVTVSNAGGVAVSMSARLTVGASGAPSITIQPQDQSVAPGGNVTFSVTAQGDATLNYQWKFNGVDIPNATSSTLTLQNVQTANAGQYQVVVSNSSGVATSSVVTLALSVSTPQILSIVDAPAGIQVTFTSRGGKTYFLETKTSIIATAWTQLSFVQGDGSVKTLTDTSAFDPVRFYRIREQ